MGIAKAEVLRRKNNRLPAQDQFRPALQGAQQSRRWHPVIQGWRGVGALALDQINIEHRPAPTGFRIIQNNGCRIPADERVGHAHDELAGLENFGGRI